MLHFGTRLLAVVILAILGTVLFRQMDNESSFFWFSLIWALTLPIGFGIWRWYLPSSSPRFDSGMVGLSAGFVAMYPMSWHIGMQRWFREDREGCIGWEECFDMTALWEAHLVSLLCLTVLFAVVYTAVGELKAASVPPSPDPQ